MGTTKDMHERAVAERFIDCYNQRHGTAYTYHYRTRGANRPDFIYLDGSREMLLEVTGAYYDDKHAETLWQSARDEPGAAQEWKSEEPDRKLVEFVNERLRDKCGKPYPDGCILLLKLKPTITTGQEFKQLISEIRIRPGSPFAEIYIAGLFPMGSRGSPGGCNCWKVAKLRSDFCEDPGGFLLPFAQEGR